MEYARWEIDGGGFYAFSLASDVTLTTQAATMTASSAGTPAQTTVVRVQSGKRIRNDTGVSFNFYPANYPEFGFTFGISASTERSPSLYLGTGVRLLSVGRRAVLSGMAGVAVIQTRRFPGVTEGQSYPSDSPLLTGVLGYRTSPFVSIHLGFSVGGGSNGTGTGGKG